MVINKEVIKADIPIWMGYFPLGLACGILAHMVGMNLWQMLFMSALVFSGSGQFIAVAMIGSSSGMLSIILTVLIVNLRYLFYGTLLNKHIKDGSWLYKALFAQFIVDEDMAINVTNFKRKDIKWTRGNALAMSSISCFGWVIATGIGIMIGDIIHINTGLANYVLVAMFIGLWSFDFSDKRLVAAGIIGGALAMVLSVFLDHMLNVVVGTVVGAALMVATEDKAAVQAQLAAEAAEGPTDEAADAIATAGTSDITGNNGKAGGAK